jgi:translation elongation factor P/translation initiation factor 5A
MRAGTGRADAGRFKICNLITRAVFDKTFTIGEKLKDPDLEVIATSALSRDADGVHVMDHAWFERVTLSA